MAKFEHGDVVRWREEYAVDERDREGVFVVLEPADDGRCFIRPVIWDAPYRSLIPTFFTSMDMLEPVDGELRRDVA